MVVFTNMFTKQIFCAPVRMKGTTAEKVAELFILHVFRTQGLPKVLLSDRYAKFTSAFWGRLFELLGTGLKFSASYHHQTNGQAERVNKTMEEALRIFVQGQPKTWPQRLGMFEFAYNSSRHSTTGMAPFQLRAVVTDVALHPPRPALHPHPPQPRPPPCAAPPPPPHGWVEGLVVQSAPNPVCGARAGPAVRSGAENCPQPRHRSHPAPRAALTRKLPWTGVP